MCGIAGIASSDLDGTGQGGAEPVVARMTAALAHRGPDAEGLWRGSKVVLGHRRLSIIDLDPASNQPFHSADRRYVISYNGEIYNFRQLRESLSQHRFRTKSDTEVLLAAWTEWGEECLHRLEGMFAFAVWDVQRQELSIARDRFGIKPLYYHVEDGRILFSSEVRSLLASGLVPRKLDEAALCDHLRHGAVHAPATIVQGVRMLLPGHLLRWSADEVRTERWWNPVSTANAAASDLDAGQVRREVRDRFSRAVEKRMVADVPFGAFLSGGIDSSAVVGAMAQATRARVHTFTVTFDEAAFSEARFAQLIAKKFGTKHTEVRLRPEDMLRMLPEALADMDHPSADGPNTWVVSKMTKEAGISMALSGLGGDEVFAGYEVFKRSVALLRKKGITAIPRPLRALIGLAVKSRRSGAAGWKAAELLKLPAWEVADTYPLARLAFSDPELRTLLAVPLRPDAVAADVRAWMGPMGGSRLEPLSQVSVAELTTYLPDVLLRDTDQMAMAHALEVRTPFLDHDLTSFVLGVPDAIKYPHTPKKLLTDALDDLLPREVTHRPKMGFTLPWDHWMREQLRSFCESRMTTLALRPQFHASGVNALWQRFLTGDPAVTWSRVWMLVVLEEWMHANAID
ncbi:MAG: asparagine synthase (glutamine-hydrolyzing) [Flavobacteriales bacterium]|jgi:asparagine synthase (glutamine-hydrolysing)|nr:asparagine synthase (glutamine-hydrolyzing) [Flavobacteriales bacterium]